MIFKRLILILFFIFSGFSVLAEVDIDQWKDSKKTYYDLIQEGFEVKAYDITNLDVQNGYIFMLFVSVLQKDDLVYECQEYQTLDENLQTLDLSFVCRKITQPYTIGIGT